MSYLCTTFQTLNRKFIAPLTLCVTVWCASYKFGSFIFSVREGGKEMVLQGIQVVKERRIIRIFPFLMRCILGLSSCLHACILHSHMKVFIYGGYLFYCRMYEITFVYVSSKSEKRFQ